MRHLMLNKPPSVNLFVSIELGIRFFNLSN